MDESFVTLVAAIKEDPYLKSVVQRAIDIGPARKQFVADLLLSLEQQQAPSELTDSLALLADDAICQRLAVYLK